MKLGRSEWFLFTFCFIRIVFFKKSVFFLEKIALSDYRV